MSLRQPGHRCDYDSVKLERLLKIPRSARTIQLVINIPESSAKAPPVLAPAKVTRWGRIWTFLKVAGPASVATAALIISLLSLRAQNSANQAAVTAAQEQDAGKVSFLDNGIPSPGSVMIENLSHSPTYDATLLATVYIPLKTPISNGYVGISMAFSLNDIPACSSGIANLIPVATKAAQSLGLFKPSPGHSISASNMLVQSMYFADANGLDWDYSSVGKLEKLTSLPKFAYDVSSVQVVYSPATGCS